MIELNMPKEQENKYADLIDCHTPEEVYANVREWTTSLSDQEHLIRSSILEIHAGVEMELKRIVYHNMSSLLFQDDNEKKNTERRAELEKQIDRMNFSSLHRILKPCLDEFPATSENALSELNNVRNQAAHGSSKDTKYKNRNPFKDHDCFAQLFFDAWAFKQGLSKFFDIMIDGPRHIAERNAKHVEECQAKSKSKFKPKAARIAKHQADK